MTYYFGKFIGISALIILSFGISLNAAAEESFDPQQATRTMEQHWQKLMEEKDPEKQKILTKEHRDMMDKAMQQSGMQGMHVGMMHESDNDKMKDHHHQHMINTMQMHYIQLDMME